MSREEASAASNLVSRLVKLLAEDQASTSVEIAETLWLATKIEVAAPAVEAVQLPPLQTPPPPLPSVDLDAMPELEPPPPPLPPIPQANLAAPTPQAGVLPPQTLPVWLADPPMLTDALAIIRALRPLLKQVDAGLGKRLDESATVEAIARTRLWLPVLKPEQRPYFDIILVVDRSSSMPIWQRLVKDVVRILKRYGLFWNVQVFDLAVNRETRPNEDAVLLIANPHRPGHRPSELIDQRRQRIAVVLSDCAGAYWWDGTLLPMLQSWGAIMPTMVWQVLPPWMWKRTALGRGTAVALANDTYGGANQWLKVQRQERDGDEADEAGRLALPVVTSDVRDLARWGLMVAGDRREITPGFLLPQPGGAVPRSRSYGAIAQDRAQRLLDDDPTLDPDTALTQALSALAHDRVERFLELASPEAQRLIMLLAAAPVISLPVVRLIRDAMLAEVTSPLPVAEVFLSGLLERLPGQVDGELEQAVEDAAQANPDPLDPVALEAQDLVQYDFAPGVRPVLLEFLPPVDTIDVVNSVSAAVERRWNRVSTEDFRAFLTDPTVPVAEELQGLRSFASVTADILESLGGDYAQFAQALRRGAEPLPFDESVGFDLSDFPLETFEYEVAEYLNFPPFEPFNFIEAQFDDQTFPPPLQTEEFTIITFEVQQDTEANEGLELFEFTVATLQRGSTERRSVEPRRGLFGNLFNDRSQQNIPEWKVHRQQQQAYRLIEALPSDIPLEMVAIPGGTFLMGSEPARHRNTESPQHEVSIESFFIGRYPVTQAQWQAVASLPRIKWQLKRNPSRFKSDNRPVESVSWNDAVEFCARLSAHTDRQYRLPTEAEWEYACRAGTTTPFHFGETITAELANYDGTAYADGPPGEMRRKTTPVDHFGIANAFGLTDMHGNVREWCEDYWHSNYDDAPADGSAWLTNEASRVIRGGSWNDKPRYCRSAYRDFNNIPDFRSVYGFRVCCAAPRT